MRDYYELCKPRVVALMLVTAIVAMLLASPSGSPLPLYPLLFGCIGIGLTALSGGAVNQIIDRHIDAKMKRTQNRPVAAGRVPTHHAIIFAIVLATLGLFTLIYFVNVLTAALSFFTLIGYAIIYTVFLKRATPQNIVIGGLAGAMPPMLGWAAVTNHMSAGAWLLVMIIFAWTPPHFWALSIHRIKDYEKAEVPMLPVIHGIPYTKRFILFYSFLLVLITYLPYAIDFTGLIYAIGITLLNVIFLHYAWRLKASTESTQNTIAWSLFKYSIWYLLLLFIVLLVDHYIPLFT